MSEAPNPDIRERAFLYALRAVRLYEYVCDGKSSAGVILGEQFLRCATSLGAAMDEAQHAASRADYIDKLEDAHKDAREALYWLRLMKDAETAPAKRIFWLEHETREIIVLLTNALAPTKAKAARRPAK